MAWLGLTLLRALFLAGLEVTWKLSLNKKKYSILTVAFWTSLVPVLALAPIVLAQQQYLALASAVYVKAILANVALNIVADILLFRMIRQHEISYVSALSATSPFFYLTFGWLFLGESISMSVFMFFFVIVSGGLMLEISRKHEVTGLKALIKSSAFLNMVTYMVLTSLATVASKTAILNGPVEGYIAFRYLLLAVGFALIYKIYNRRKGILAPSLLHKDNFPLIVAGMFLTVAVVAEMYAYALTDIALVDAVSKLALVFTFVFEYIFIRRAFNFSRGIAVILIMLGTAAVAILS